MDLQQEVEQHTPNNLILQMLHDDELIIIFTFLDVPDLIRMEKVCKRFAKLAKHVYKSSFKVYDFEKLDKKLDKRMRKNVTFQEGMQIASRVGSYVETLTLGTTGALWMNDNQVAKLLSTYFTNLQKIKIYGLSTMTENSTRKIALALRTLKNVELENGNYDDEKLMSLFRLEQLDTLKIEFFYDLTGIFLKELSNITVLNLNNCSCIHPQFFVNLCVKRPNLRSLSLFGCIWIDSMCLCSIAENLKNLEELSVSDNYDMASPEDYLLLTNLTKLKHVGLCEFYSGNGEIFNLLSRIAARNELESLRLIKSQIQDDAIIALKNLKLLDLWGYSMHDFTLNTLSCENTLQRLILSYNYQITPHGLEQLIARCPLINFISISNCKNIDRSFVHQIIPHLKERSHMLKLEMKDILFPKEEFGNYLGVNSSRLMLINCKHI